MDDRRALKLDIWISKPPPRASGRPTSASDLIGRGTWRSAASVSILREFNDRYHASFGERELRWTLRQVANHLSHRGVFDSLMGKEITYQWADFTVEETLLLYRFRYWVAG